MSSRRGEGWGGAENWSSITMERDTAIEFQETDAQEASGDRAVFDQAMVRNIPFDADPEQEASSERLLAGFKASEEDTSSDRIATVGTGGVGMWERSWSKMVAEELDAPSDPVDTALAVDFPENRGNGLVRAMAAAQITARPYDLAQNDFGHSVYRHTESARQQREQFNRRADEAVEKYRNRPESERDSVVDKMSEQEIATFQRNLEAALAVRRAKQERDAPMEADLAKFMTENPETGVQQMRAAETAGKQVVDLGQHLTMLGFRNGEVDLVRGGRAMMADGAQQTRDAPRQEGAIARLGETWIQGSNQDDAEAKGVSRADYTNRLLETFNPRGLAEQDSRAFIGEAVAAQDLSSIYNRNVDALAGLGAKDGGAAFWMRSVSDNIFKKKESPVATNVADALASGDPKAAGDAYQQAFAVGDAIVDITRNLRAEGFNAPDAGTRSAVESEIDELVADGMLPWQVADTIQAGNPQLAPDPTETGPVAELRKELSDLAMSDLRGAARLTGQEEEDENGRRNDAYWIRASQIRSAAGIMTLLQGDRLERAAGASE